MKTMVYLIGTDHKYQYNSDHYIPVSAKEIQDFINHLKTICIENNIIVIGEEFHENNLKEDRNITVPKHVALELNIEHIYCEPDDDEARRLGYKDIVFQKRNETTEEFDKRSFENEKIRENGWLDKIISYNKWPLLFICGSWHVKSFKKLLETNLVNVKTVNENWPSK